MINDREFSSPGEEFNPPAPEFAPPAPEHSRSGREFGQSAGTAAPPKKRRRVPGFMFAAAAVVTATVALSAPAAVEFPQPENFTAEYRAYLDDIMEACETEDPLAVHRLATDPMANEFWTECMEPYRQSLHQKGLHKEVYYDGSVMTPEPGNVPALSFFYRTFQWEPDTAPYQLSYHTMFTYFQHGSQRRDGTWGVDYSGGQSFTAEDPFCNIYIGELSHSEFDDYYISFRQGTYQQYNHRRTGLPGPFRLERSLTGTFSHAFGQDEQGLDTFDRYLENGTWTEYFPEGAAEIEVVDGSIVLNDHIELHPDTEPGLYSYATVWPGRMGLASEDGEPCTLEELLYHPDPIRAY